MRKGELNDRHGCSHSRLAAECRSFPASATNHFVSEVGSPAHGGTQGEGGPLGKRPSSGELDLGDPGVLGVHLLELAGNSLDEVGRVRRHRDDDGEEGVEVVARAGGAELSGAVAREVGDVLLALVARHVQAQVRSTHPPCVRRRVQGGVQAPEHEDRQLVVDGLDAR